jgi:hypothetical protein
VEQKESRETPDTALKAKRVPTLLLAGLDNPLPDSGIRLAAVGAAFGDRDKRSGTASVVMELNGRD